MKKRTFALLIVAVMLSILLCGALTACDKAGTAADPEPVESEIAEVVSEPESEPEKEPESEPEAESKNSEYPYSWYTEKKAVLADMTSEEVFDYTVPFILSCGSFTDANTIGNQEMLMLLAYKNYPAWKLDPSLWKDGGVRMTYDEVVEELQHYLDFDPEKVNLKKSFGYDPETETFLFTCDFGGDCPYILLDDKWEGDRRIITLGDDLEHIYPADLTGEYNKIFTLEQNGEYVRYVSFEAIPAE